ncbi:unnamed protein product, partial [Rodentolepis nana]|uniref:COPI_C domain-containing protein n=1 Tax=Rodentolepis nana TaxID=102285 RepID=A0A0R3TIV7_RODNA
MLSPLDLSLQRRSTIVTSINESECLSSLAQDTIPVANVSHHSPDNDERTGGICTALALAELGFFYCANCNYHLACRLANLALRRICMKSSSPRVVIQVLRLVCQICLIQRKFVLGKKIIQLVAQFTSSVASSGSKYCWCMLKTISDVEPD